MENPDDSPFINKGEIEGYVRKDQFGRLYIDKCEDDETHLTKPRGERDAEGKAKCRRYIEDMIIPDSYIGKKIKFSIDIRGKVLKEGN